MSKLQNHCFKWTFTIVLNEWRIKLSKGPDRIHLVRNLKIEKGMSELLNNLMTADIVILVIFSTVEWSCLWQEKKKNYMVSVLFWESRLKECLCHCNSFVCLMCSGTKLYERPKLHVIQTMSVLHKWLILGLISGSWDVKLKSLAASKFSFTKDCKWWNIKTVTGLSSVSCALQWCTFLLDLQC